ncbi:hypothetical protein TCAL_08589 [Tigriopus californicus]|uniref:Partial AB-hydrolase lipase domain-containing protein n=1 Tax=Tigriopus californicus TaxID=6832 RepID=A0A553P1U3_TIGCA|nr:lipase 3-like [Tigriopus californicus]TRY71661.1 hypothetical protein TCAL_08589 [Tigriopus californicus]
MPPHFNHHPSSLTGPSLLTDEDDCSYPSSFVESSPSRSHRPEYLEEHKEKVYYWNTVPYPVPPAGHCSVHSMARSHHRDSRCLTNVTCTCPTVLNQVSDAFKQAFQVGIKSGWAVGLLGTEIGLNFFRNIFIEKGPTHIMKTSTFIFRVMSGDSHFTPPVFQELAAKVSREGFIIENHPVTTDDGYKLNMHRIQRRKGEVNKINKRVVFVQHGLKCSSADWIIGKLAYVLCDSDCDVWMGNFRGNTYSKGHVSMSTDSEEFWDFSWDEHGKSDLPAMIDYVLQHTQRSQIEFVCHSMGSTAFFVMMNYYPDMNRKIKRASIMAPVTNIEQVFGHPRRFLHSAEMSINVANALGLHAINLPKNVPFYAAISTLVTYATGYYDCDSRTLTDILAFSPASTSTKNILHYLACRKRGSFGNFDGTRTYSLTQVTCPVVMYWSASDWAAGRHDVAGIRSQLANLVEEHQVEDENFGHLDFMWGRSAMKIYRHMALNPPR